MKLVTIILTAVSLAACHVEGPGGGEAKFTPEGQTEWKGAGFVRMKWGGGLHYVLATAEGHPDQLFVFSSTWGSSAGGRAGKMVDIWAVNDKLRPLTNSCVDRYTKMAPFDSPTDIDKGSKNVKINWDKDKRKGNETPLDFEYTVPDSDGVLVTYKYRGMHQDEPIMISSELMESIQPEEDCDHVSQSGEEEGSAAP